jgi:PAS domain S-box-containing protein
MTSSTAATPNPDAHSPQAVQRAMDFMQCASEGVVFYTQEGILDCNVAFEKLLGYSRASLVGQNALVMFPAHDHEMALRHIYLGRGMPINAKLVARNGKLVDAEVTGRLATYNGQDCWVATLRDTKTEVYVTESLVRSQARYRALVENADQVIMFVQDRKLAYANPAAAKFFKLHPSDMHTRVSVQLIHPEDRALALRRRKEMLAGDPDRTVMLRTLSPPSEQVEPDSVISWVQFYGSLVEWEGRAATLIFMTDLTAQHETQERLSHALLHEKELGDLKTRFVSMASHEFRTPLATIQTSSELLQHYSERLSAAEKDDAIVDIQRSVQRMQAMMENFLAFGRMSADAMQCKPVAVKLLPLVQEIVNDALALDGHQHVIDVRMRAPVHDALVLPLDAMLVRQMLGNLLSNACKYSNFGDPIDLLLERADSTPGLERTLPMAHMQAPDYQAKAIVHHLRIVVTDRGIGIPQMDVPLLFGSFHRASNAANIPGTGLGLAIVDRAVRSHGGTVSVRSVEGEGAAFELLLPWVEGL